MNRDHWSDPAYSRRGGHSGGDAPPTPYSSKWQAPTDPPEPVDPETLRVVYAALRDRVSTALGVAASTGLDYGHAFRACEMLADMHRADRLTNARYRVRP